jgi:hypothetical protein
VSEDGALGEGSCLEPTDGFLSGWG